MSLSRRCSSGDLAAHSSYPVLLLSSFTGETRLHSPTAVIDSVQMLVSPPPPSAATNHTKLLNFLAWRWKILATVLRSLHPPDPPDPLGPPGLKLPISSTVLHLSRSELPGCYSDGSRASIGKVVSGQLWLLWLHRQSNTARQPIHTPPPSVYAEDLSIPERHQIRKFG
ncbi:unnamed protein product [Arabis nemorensis]|uniref:Uncharacterized protein n=1 Tax=Arabis nemorensis TaxID=586526 RepID=A0A565BMF0_9BRAS|nr:unnamed protein product [Arabis nemorensis]